MRELEADARDRLFDRLAVDEDAFPPVGEQPEPTQWWERLEFDPEGTKLAYQGKEWSPEDLATSDPELARYSAALLKGKSTAADINNRACALVYADPAELTEPAKLLADINGQSKADGNLAILKRAEPAAAIAGA